MADRMANRANFIAVFSWEQVDAANEYAASIGGTVESIPYDPEKFGGGFHAVVHPHPEGLTVTRWDHGTLPTPGVLVRRDSLKPGDVVYTGTELGVQTVSEVLYDGRESGYLRFEKHGLQLFADKAAALIPVLERELTPATRTLLDS